MLCCRSITFFTHGTHKYYYCKMRDSVAPLNENSSTGGVQRVLAPLEIRSGAFVLNPA